MVNKMRFRSHFITEIPDKGEDLRSASSPREYSFMAKEAQRVSLSNFYGNVDPRRKPEVADSQMLNEDHRAMANLPTQEINRQWVPGKFAPQFWLENEVTEE